MSNSCDPVNCSQPGSSVHEISQARILEWVAISFSGGSSKPRDKTWVSCTKGGLLHCRKILYQLSQQGSPINTYNIKNNIIRHILFPEASEVLWYKVDIIKSTFCRLKHIYTLIRKYITLKCTSDTYSCWNTSGSLNSLLSP